MAWTTPGTAVAGSVATAAFFNVNVRDDLAYLKSVVDGTGATKIATPSAFPDPTDFTGRELRVGKNVPGGAPGNITDTLSFFFNRSAADHEASFINCHISPAAGAKSFTFVANAYSAFLEVLGVTNDGKLTGKGFYSSGEFSLTNTSSTNLAHGLAARPRFLYGFHINATGSENSKIVPVAPAGVGAQVTFGQADATNINVINNNGATRYIHVYAIL